MLLNDTRYFKKKGVIITGSATRIGRAIAMFLASKGYDIVVHYHTSKSQALNLKKNIEELYQRTCLILQADLLNFATLHHIIDHTFQIMPYCNNLINNASIFYPHTLMQCTELDFDQNYHIHVKVPMFLTQYFAKKCHTTGNIVNIIDSNITHNKSKYFTYMLSKKSLADLTKFTATELAPRIKVNAVCPSAVDDNVLESIFLTQIMQNNILKNILKKVYKLVKINNNITGKIYFS
ncbi:SDR family NAD(P)-dependent oxidoreductase [Candidatus Neoehrlichia procyonis]|uniref:Short chain dehydrogenase family protein n=1 Tax=Candidatus Neoehrlichia procyonis str. RAC413 TaxID=1359163 RepID=A0A0F3NMG4_9RICK|nr:SDR family NAD(P)-dependent oxidoreductase [Candidatus Neoehrlichia lotoris]KJV69230.1 short chain dehydrogenase family protein [Candidatus Neoehrlichia lotoris str. RAC413]